MKVAYVAGPYRSKWGIIGICINIIRAWRIARELWKMGYIVICPHTNCILMSGEDIPEDYFLTGDMELLKKCDLMVLIPGWPDSKGTISEILLAHKINLPVYQWKRTRELELIEPKALTLFALLDVF
jgi:hypothetical protein